MSEDPNIRIGKQGRKFKNMRYLETDTVGGDSCFWVPETARKLTDGYFDKNGYYVPKKYGFDALQVHVSKTVTDIDGVDWTIGIDPIDIPDINPEIINTIIDDLDIDIDDIDIDDLDDILDEFGIDIDIDDLRDVIIDLGIDPDDIDIDDIIQIIDYIQDIDDIDIEDIDIDDITDIMDDLGIDPDNIGPGDVQDILDDLGIDIPIDDLQDIMDGLGIDPDNIDPDDIVDLLPYVDGDEFDPTDPFDPDNPPDPEVPVYPGNPDDPGFDPDSFDPDTFDPDSFEPEDFFPEQFYPDIYGPEPFDPDKYYPDGYDPDGYDPGLFDPDGLGPDPIPDYDGFDDEDPIDDGLPQVPNIGLPDGGIDCPFDPETGLPTPMHDGEPIAPDAFPDFPGTLPDGEWDFSFDPPADMDDPDFDPTDIPWEMSFPGADGLPEGWTFDPKTGEWSLTELPDEIRIMHVPNKTVYMDGEEIDLDGLVVQAYRGGEVWTSEQYPDGYIPVHELTYSPHEAAQECKYYYDPRTGRTYTVYTQLSHDYFLKYDYIYHGLHYSQRYSLDFNSQAMYTAQNGIFIITSYRGTGCLIGKTPDAVCNVFCKKWGTNNCNSSRPEQSEDKNINYTFNVGRVNYLDHDTEKPYYFARIYSSSLVGEYSTVDYSLPEESTDREVNYAIRGDYYDYDVLPPDFDFRYNTSFLGRLLYGATDGDMVRVSWSRPKDNKVLEATFVISVDIEIDPEGGAGGHWGGTTPSGEYGGSHYSGKF